MNGDSDFEEEETEDHDLDQQLLDAQAGHFGLFAQKQAKGKGGVWQEWDDLDAQADAYMAPPNAV
eukprot:10637941-Heterocapsa_arctica.AAC.1